jgi:hypothetical protein
LVRASCGNHRPGRRLAGVGWPDQLIVPAELVSPRQPGAWLARRDVQFGESCRS